MTDPVVSDAARKLAQQSSFVREAQRATGKTYGPDNRGGPATLSEIEAIRAAGQSVPDDNPNAGGGGEFFPSGSGGEPGASEPSRPAAAPGEEGPQGSEPPSSYRLQLNGQEVEMPREHVEALVGRAREADRIRQEAETLKEMAGSGLAFLQWFQRHATPEQRQAIEAVAKGQVPQGGVQGGAPAGRSTEGLDEDDFTAPASQPPASVPPELVNTLKFLVEREAAREQQEAVRSRESLVDSTLAKYPRVFSEPGVKDYARQAILAELSANPNADPLQVTVEHASKIAAWRGQASAQGQGSAQGGLQGGQPPKQFTASDLESGAVRKAVMQRLRQGA